MKVKVHVYRNPFTLFIYYIPTYLITYLSNYLTEVSTKYSSCPYESSTVYIVYDAYFFLESAIL